MKKILTILLFLLVGFTGMAQFKTHEYDQIMLRAGGTYATNIITSNQRSFGYNAFMGGVGLQYLNMISDVVVLRVDGDMAFGMVGNEPKPIGMLGVGVELGNFHQPHWILEVRPRISWHGDGPQSEGSDHTALFISFTTGGSYRYPLSHGYIYTEAGIVTTLDIISMKGYERNSIGFYITIGYSFIIR